MIKTNISIHTLHAEGDNYISGRYYLWDTFLSTPSMRRVTIYTIVHCADLVISIHTLHAEGDLRKE